MEIDEYKGLPFNELLDKISIMVDFSVNLMRYDIHTPTNVFPDCLLSYNFFPYIIETISIRKYYNKFLDKNFRNYCF